MEEQFNCFKCKSLKPRSDFVRPGRENICRVCAKERWKEWKERTGYKYDQNKDSAKKSRSEWKKRQSPDRKFLMRSINGAYQRARESGVPYNLTRKYVYSVWDGQSSKCAMCGLSFGEFGSMIDSPSMDRISPELGYVEGNIRFVFFGLNALKGTGTDEQVLSLCKAVVEHHS